jgi:hypothetical protein
LSLARNPISNTYFAVSHDSVGTQDGGVEIAPDGQPLTSGVQVTSIGGTGNFYPRLTASSARPDWYVSAANVFTSTVGQRITTATVASGGGPPPPPPNPCTGSLGSSSVGFNYLGGGGGVSLTIGSTCSWTATSSDTSWLTVNSGSGSGTGGQLITFTVAANPSVLGRSATLNIGGQTYTVSQSGVPCTFDVTPPVINIGAGTADGTANVFTPGACGWSATSHNSFMTFTGAKSGTGSAPLPFTVAANPSTIARVGSATIAGHTLTINQAGAPFNAAARARENARADFDGNGESDLVLQNVNTGSLGAWLFADLAVAATPSLSHGLIDYTNWRVMGTGDFNSDGQPDIVLQHLGQGWIYVWYMNGTTRAASSYTSFSRLVDVRWRIAAVGDMNQDGKPDIVWQHPDGWLALWLMNGVTLIASVPLTPGSVQDVQWQIAGMGDFNGDGKNDLLWRHTGRGDLGVWFMDGTTRIGFSPLQPGVVVNQEWQIAAVIDANRDNTPDIVWQHASEGWTVVWLMIGTERIAAPNLPTLPSGWVIAGGK